MSSNEQVLTFPSFVRNEPGVFSGPGFNRSTQEDVESSGGLFEHIQDTMLFMDRDKAETEEKALQIIPYVLISKPNEDNDGLEYYVYRRTSGGGDERLFGTASLGFGGHINPCDGAIDDPIYYTILNTIVRELDEEVDIFDVKGNEIRTNGLKMGQFNYLGEVYLDKTEVDRVHYGVVYELRLPRGAEVAVREHHKMRDLGWLDLNSIDSVQHDFNIESWSEAVLNVLGNQNETVIG